MRLAGGDPIGAANREDPAWYAACDVEIYSFLRPLLCPRRRLNVELQFLRHRLQFVRGAQPAKLRRFDKERVGQLVADSEIDPR
jgi:hypothetical protein